MIKALIRFGRWLESRFPEKLVVTAAEYAEIRRMVGAAHAELNMLRDELREMKQSHTATIDRVARVEASAVHKGAVQDLVEVVKVVKDDLVALKANLGWSKGIVGDAQQADKLAAFLNGDIVHGE